MIAPRIACWSERHTAYICGLGTFSMSRGLITEKGMAGRFGSIVTNVVLPVRKREYSSLFEYCNHCGKCAINCPAGAIDVSKDIEDAKDNQVCTEFITEVCRPYQREGGPHHHCCGKCQVNVPCQNGIPHR